MIKDSDFEIFLNDLKFAYQQFCVNVFLHKKVGSTLYNYNDKFRYIWDMLLLGSESDYLIGLAKMFERPKELEKTISIYCFLEYPFKDCMQTIDKIMKARNKILAHSDLKVSRKRTEFWAKDVNLNVNETKLLFNKIIDTMNKIKDNYKYNEDIDKTFGEIAVYTSKAVDAWLAPFKKLLR